MATARLQEEEGEGGGAVSDENQDRGGGEWTTGQEALFTTSGTGGESE